MTPTGKAELRERARKYLVDRAEIGWSEDKVVGFAESEALLARKEVEEEYLRLAVYLHRRDGHNQYLGITYLSPLEDREI